MGDDYKRLRREIQVLRMDIDNLERERDAALARQLLPKGCVAVCEYCQVNADPEQRAPDFICHYEKCPIRTQTGQVGT